MNMLDQILLAPYYLSLRLRHALYDSGLKKTYPAGLPSISIGNVTVGGTGKTPHTEMLIRLLSGHPAWSGKQIAVLSRGYKRKSRGFQQVITEESDAAYYGDEPVQIKRKFPDVTVAVDKDRVEGCGFLLHPDSIKTSRKGRKCRHKEFAPADIVILDDAFQYRKLRPSASLLLIDWNRPLNKDRLLPFGRLRDLPSRLKAADSIIITKCPPYINEEERESWIDSAGLRDCGKNIYFTTIEYGTPQAVFPEGDKRYAYSPRAILFSGIANNRPMRQYVAESYRILKTLDFPDHHKYSASDIRSIYSASKANPTALVLTTEKDAQRIMERKDIPDILKSKLFYLPIKVRFIDPAQEKSFRKMLICKITPNMSMQ